MFKRFGRTERAVTTAALLLLGVFAVIGAPYAQTYIDQIRRPKIINGALTLPNDEQIDNNTNGAVEFQGVAGTDNTDLRIDLDGTRPVIDSPTDAAVEIAEALVIGGVLTLENSETIDTTVDAQFRFTRNTAGTVTIIGADNATPATTIYDTTGAGAIQVGSVDVTAITLQTDDTGDGTDLVLPAQGVGASEVLNDTLTFAQWSDSSAIDADTTLTAADGIDLTYSVTHTAGDTNFLSITAAQTDDANATDDFDVIRLNLSSESGDAADTFEGIVGIWANGTANTVIDAFVRFDNAETTAATVTDAIIITSSGVDGGVVDAIDASAANITNSINVGINRIAGGNDDFFQAGATDATLLYTRDTAGAVTFAGADDAGAADTVYDTTGAGMCFVGSLDVTDVIAIAAETRVRNGATGNVILGFQDFADSAVDDMDHAQILVNCTDTADGAEDCDISINVVEAGAAPETRIFCDADGGCTIGSANTNSVTIDTDTDTGDADFVLPLESVSAAEIVNLIREVNLPVSAWYNCTADAIISTDDAADAQPDWAFLNSGLVISYDDTPASIDTDFVCTSFRVPPDYVSGARMAFVASQNAATATVEDIGCAWSINGAADSGETTAVLVSQIAAQVVTVTPAGAPAAGDSIGVRCRQSDAAADDTVYFHATAFNYTATQ